MTREPKPPIERLGDQYSINLEPEERELIHRLMLELRQLLDDPDDADGRLRRLYPAAYHQEADRGLDEEYQRLMRDELLASRLKGLDLVDHFMATGSRHLRVSQAEMFAFL